MAMETGGGGAAPVEKITGRGVTNAKTGTTVSPGRFGQFQTNDLATMYAAAQDDPDIAAMLLRLAQGRAGRPLGLLASTRDNLYGKAFQTALSLAGAGGGQFGDVEDMGNDFLQNAVLGNNLIGYGQGLSNDILGMDFSGIDAPTMQALLQGGLALGGIGMGGIGKRVNQGYLQDILWDTLARELGDTNQSDKNFADLLANSPYKRAMAAFGR